MLNLTKRLLLLVPGVKGDIVNVGGDMATIMAGLACGEPNPLGWEILRNCATQFISCQDSVAALGMRVLGNPYGNDPRIISGESGAESGRSRSGSLSPATSKPDGKTGAEQKSAVVLVISTEGDTDVKHYREVVWEGKHAVAPLITLLELLPAKREVKNYEEVMTSIPFKLILEKAKRSRQMTRFLRDMVAIPMKTVTGTA